MRPPLLPVLLLCMLGTAQVLAQEKGSALRLCGRALLRAVVYTCGGSRWRRLTAGEEALRGRSRGPGAPTDAVDRRWRDQNQALIRVCCAKGCRKSDLSMLC